MEVTKDNRHLYGVQYIDPLAGPNITGHPLIASAYADRRLNPNWRLT